MGAYTYFAIAILAGLVVGLVLVIHGTIVKNRWGVNLRRVECPNCGTVMGRVRVPTSGEQAMWGGYTCPTCKAELDKWGRRISRPA
jgi:DNA-directed RNA polymerase subunit RPC12/RpoP